MAVCSAMAARSWFAMPGRRRRSRRRLDALSRWRRFQDLECLQAMRGASPRRDKRQQGKRNNAAFLATTCLLRFTHDPPQNGFKMS
jgi:hypothetical protein